MATSLDICIGKWSVRSDNLCLVMASFGDIRREHCFGDTISKYSWNNSTEPRVYSIMYYTMSLMNLTSAQLLVAVVVMSLVTGLTQRASCSCHDHYQHDHVRRAVMAWEFTNSVSIPSVCNGALA